MDGPEKITGMRRQVINFKWLRLTDITVGAARNARQKSLSAAWEKAGAEGLWKNSAWAKKIAAKAAKAATTDFDRFKAKQAAKVTRTKVRAQPSLKKLLA